MAAPRPDRGRTERDTRRRTLSQNFLKDSGAVAEYLRLVDLDPGLPVLEIGAGRGQITEALADRGLDVTAYELDPAMAPDLRDRLRDRPNVALVVGDFVASLPPDVPFQVVGNVPFGITAPIVDWCLRARELVTATMITQLEYARKRTGSYGRWSLLTVLTWPGFSWELRGRIARTRFRPVPAVDAGVLRIAQRLDPLIPYATEPAYTRMVELGFTGIGGTLFASMSKRYPTSALTAAFRTAGLDRDVVVAFVHPEQWIELFRILERVPG